MPNSLAYMFSLSHRLFNGSCLNDTKVGTRSVSIFKKYELLVRGTLSSVAKMIKFAKKNSNLNYPVVIPKSNVG